MRWAHLVILAAILITAAFLRFYGLGWLPPGLFHDEAAIGLDALDVLKTGQFPVYFERTTGGQEPLFGYLTALSFVALGPGIPAMRVVAPAVGLLTVAVTYALGQEMHGRWVALVAALLMAVSYWHVHVSHTSFRAITLPLMAGLTFLLLWRALARGAPWRYALAGLSGAVTMYTYQSSRLFPLLIALAFLYLWACRGRRFSWPGVAGFAGTMAAVTVPLAWYYLNHPIVFSARIEQVGAGGADVWEGLANTLGMFSLQGDITWKFNLPGKPVFDPLVSGLFYLGTIVSLRRWRQPPYGLLLLWVAVMLLPTILSTESPHFLRAMGIMPAVYLLPGVGAIWLVGLLGRWAGALSGSRAASLVYLVLAVWLAVGATTTYRDYFGEWAASPNSYEVYNGDVQDAARYLNTLDGSQTAMFSTQYYRHYTVLFLERRSLDLRWFDGRQSLPLPEPDGRDVVYIYPASAMPARSLIESVLGPESLVKEGHGPHGQLSFLAYRLSAARLTRARSNLVPPTLTSARIGREVELMGYQAGGRGAAVRPEVRPGETLPLTLYWRVLQGTDADYSFFSHLLDTDGRMWGQGDTNKYWSQEWRPGDLVLGRYDIEVDSKTPAGRYTIEVGVFDRQTGTRLGVSTGGEAKSLEAAKVAQLTQPSLEGAGQAMGTRFGDAIELRAFGRAGAGQGLRLPSRVRAGELLDISLFWRASGLIQEDYTVFLHLLDASGHMVAQADSQPQGGAFPTSFWDPDEVVADRLQLTVPANIPPGSYELRIGLYQLSTGRRLPVSGVSALGDQAALGQLEVAAP